jgi:hypothetical protein
MAVEMTKIISMPRSYRKKRSYRVFRNFEKNTGGTACGTRFELMTDN